MNDHAVCPCCDPVMKRKAAEFTNWLLQAREERKIREQHLLRGDCQYCIDNNEACNYSCVGV